MDRSRHRLWTIAAALVMAVVFSGAVTDVDARRRGKKKKKRGDVTAATIGDRSISLQELDEKAAAALMKVRQQEYEVRARALEGIIKEELLAQEAGSLGLTADQLLEIEINSRITAPPQSEIDIFYEQSKARFGAQTRDQLLPQITNILRSQKQNAAEQAYLRSLRQKYGVRVMIDPPRLDVSLDDDPTRGPEDAPITIVEFSDYECPFCNRAEETIHEVLARYGDQVRLVYRDFPLSFHKNAEIASIGAGCANEQGKFWEMHGAMFADQKKLTAADLVETAAGVGLDREAFEECLDSGRFREEVQNDLQDGQKYGVTGTPTFFINGIMLVGAQSPDAFYRIIERELERADD